jgi:hypothetical protein
VVFKSSSWKRITSRSSGISRRRTRCHLRRSIARSPSRMCGLAWSRNALAPYRNVSR